MLQYFKMVFLEIQNVTTWLVFPNPVTFDVHNCLLQFCICRNKFDDFNFGSAKTNYQTINFKIQRQLLWLYDINFINNTSTLANNLLTRSNSDCFIKVLIMCVYNIQGSRKQGSKGDTGPYWGPRSCYFVSCHFLIKVAKDELTKPLYVCRFLI